MREPISTSAIGRGAMSGQDDDPADGGARRKSMTQISSGGSRPLQDLEMVIEAVKSPPVIQVERSSIVEVGVHENRRRSVTSQPGQAVAQQCGSDAHSLEFGVDSESLDESRVSAATRDHVADAPVVSGDGQADPVLRRCQAGLANVRGIHFPFGVECFGVDFRCELHGSHRTQRSQFVDRWANPAQTRKDRCIVEFEQGQTLDLMKANFGENGHDVAGDRPGSNGRKATLRQDSDPFLQSGNGGTDGVIRQDEMGHI